MARDVSIEVSLIDRVSPQFNNMTKASTAFRKDLEETLKVLNSFSKTKISLKMDAGGVLKSLKSAEEQSLKTSGAFEDLNAKINNTDFSPINGELEETNKKAQDTAKSISELGTAISKENNKSTDKSLTDKVIGDTSKVKDFLKSGVLNMLGDSMVNILSTDLTSTFGNEGKTASTVISGALSGAAMGSVVPGIGTAIGAAIGTVAGVLNAEAEKFAAEDDAFRNVKQKRYEDAMQLQNESLQNGVGIAAQREKDSVYFSNLFQSDALSGKDIVSRLNEITNTTPAQYNDLVGMTRTLSPAFKEKPEEALAWVKTISNVGNKLGMDSSTMNSTAASIGAISNAEQVTEADLTSLTSIGIDVIGYLRDSNKFTDEKTGEPLTEEELKTVLSDKGLSGEAVAAAISTGLEKDYTNTDNTYSDLVAIQKNLQDNMDASMGAGYENERKKGLEEQIEWMGGSSGEKMQGIYEMIGEYKASLENEHESAIRESLDNAMISEEYIKAARTDNRKEMGRILAEAQAQAENEYMASDAYQGMLATQEQTISNIAEDLVQNKAYYNAGKRLGDELSKGINDAAPTGIMYWIKNGLTADEAKKQAMEKVYEEKGYIPGYPTYKPSTPNSENVTTKAFGMNYVPYDNFPALLHQGERVLTASEARQADRGNGNITVNVNGNFSVRNDGDARLIAQEIVSEFMAVQSVM